jgi:Flp pilus assembly protein TadG
MSQKHRMGEKMKTLAKRSHDMLSSAQTGIARFCAEKNGAAAVEFAFIAPLLITMYLGTMEISQGIEINKKVGRSASLIGDIVAQDDNLTMDDLRGIMKIGAAVLQPYERDAPTIKITGIRIDADADATVAWSQQGVGEVYSSGDLAGSDITVPVNLKIENTFLIKVEASLEYLPITSWTIQKNKSGPDGAYASVPMKEVYYLRPRVENEVVCTDCPTPPI